MSLDCLPDEVLAEKILLRLPVKSIIQCRCVCKSWCSLITNPNFISTHLIRNRKTLTENPQIFVIQKDNITGSYLFLFGDYLRPMSLHLPPHPPCPETILRILGSINGLICISICQGSIFNRVNLILFNPSIGRFLSILPPPQTSPKDYWSVEGFGFDETTQDHKILLIREGDSVGFLYSLNSDSWRSLITPPVPPVCASQVFVNGGIHWLACHTPSLCDSIYSMMVFDVKGETFRHISLPECLVSSRGSLSVKEFGDSSSIALTEHTVEHVTHIWVMKEYGSVESWIKLATVESLLLGFINKDQVLIRLTPRVRVRKTQCIVSQNINNELEEVKILLDMGDYAPFHFSPVYKYVPSLVLLDKANNVDATFVDATPFPTEEEQPKQLELGRSKRRRKSPAWHHSYVL